MPKINEATGIATLDLPLDIGGRVFGNDRHVARAIGNNAYSLANQFARGSRPGDSKRADLYRELAYKMKDGLQPGEPLSDENGVARPVHIGLTHLGVACDALTRARYTGLHPEDVDAGMVGPVAVENAAWEMYDLARTRGVEFSDPNA